jgi:hypothetical protein
MLKKFVPLILLCFFPTNCNCTNNKLPIISHERRVEYRVLEGNCGTVHMSGGNKDLQIFKKGIQIKNKKFRFKKNIKSLLVKYNFNYGACIEYGYYTFDQVIQFPIKIESDPITKDSIEILNVKNKTIQCRKNNKMFVLRHSDSISFFNSKTDTTYNNFNNNKQRLVLQANYKTTLKYMATLDLKTLYFIDGKNNFNSTQQKKYNKKAKRTRRKMEGDVDAPVYSTQQPKPAMQQ